MQFYAENDSSQQSSSFSDSSAHSSPFNDVTSGRRYSDVTSTHKFGDISSNRRYSDISKKQLWKVNSPRGYSNVTSKNNLGNVTSNTPLAGVSTIRTLSNVTSKTPLGKATSNTPLSDVSTIRNLSNVISKNRQELDKVNSKSGYSEDANNTPLSDVTTIRNLSKVANSVVNAPMVTGPTTGSGTTVTGCRKRKQFCPIKTRPLNDPDFRGVTITMRNVLVGGKWELHMTSTFTLSPKRKRKPYADSSDEEEYDTPDIPTPPSHYGEKHCASCSVRKTPLWRDAEDGTPLCNACGIRYKKYNLRCGTCWHIPKKDELQPICHNCGSYYEYVCNRRQLC